MNKKQSTIYDKGWEAYGNGKNISLDCPYVKQKDVEIWMEGFNDALIDQTCDNPQE